MSQLPKVTVSDVMAAAELSPSIAWPDKGKREHVVEFYEKDAFLVDSVAGFLSAGLSAGENAVVVATKLHNEAIEKQLQKAGVDVISERRAGRYVALDASDTLSQFMIEGMPDEHLFQQVIGTLIARMSLGRPGLRVFGEMVALLWANNSPSAAICLEQLWNKLGVQHTFSLFCAYPINKFGSNKSGEPFFHICQEHSRVIPAESYSAESDPEARLRTIALLQQQAHAFHAELAERKCIEAELRRSQQELKTLLESASVGIHWVGPDGHIQWANVADMEFLGYSKEEYIGRHIAEFHVDRAVIEDILARLARNETIQSYEARLKAKDGSVRHVLIDSSVFWEDGRFIHTQCFTRDITARKQSEEALVQRTRSLEVLNRVGGLLAGEANVEKVVQAVTDAGRELSGAAFGAFFYNVKNSRGESYLLYTLSGASREDFVDFSMPRSTSLFALTFSGQGIVRVGDVLKDARYGKSGPHYGMPKGHLPTRSYLAVPVVSRSGAVLGGLFFGHPEPDIFTEESERTLQSLAAQAAIAIDNANLQACSRQLASIVESSRDAIIGMDLQGTITSWNKGAEQIYGYSQAEAVGQPVTMLIPRQRLDEELQIMARLGRNERVEHYETIRQRKDGSEIDISLTASAVRDSDGRIIGASKIARDITARKRMERELIQSEARIRQLMALMPAAVYACDAEGRITFYNRRAVDLWGREPRIGDLDERFCGAFRLWKPDGTVLRHDMTPMANAVRHGISTRNGEVVIGREDGSRIIALVNIDPILDSEGHPRGAINVFHDITERRRTEEQQRALYDLVATVNRAEDLPQTFEAAVDAICRCHDTNRASILLYDSEGAMRFRAWRKLSDDYRRAVEGHSPWQRDDPDPQPICIGDVATVSLEEGLRSVIAREGIRALAFVPITYDKRLLGKFMLYYDAPRHFSEAEIHSAQTIASQVAFAIERQQTEEGLERLVSERTASLKEAVAQMEEFSYTVSHDLRAPLRGMQTYSQALLEDFAGALGPEAVHYLRRISDNAARLDKMILDVLTLSRITRTDLRQEPVSLTKLLHEIVQHYPSMQAPQAQIRIDPLLDVLGHEPSLTQAVSNLLSNAVKFVPPGVTPEVRVWTERREDLIRLWVEDKGIGIDPKYHHRLFTMFERIHPQLKYEGTGVGLAIVRKAVERMGGKVGLESDGATGSRFWIELRQAPVKQ